jgi:hypothetical protein
MRVRVRENFSGVYYIEKKVWWWPFWMYITLSCDGDIAFKQAKRLFNGELTTEVFE